jgi:hypothetical protein
MDGWMDGSVSGECADLTDLPLTNTSDDDDGVCVQGGAATMTRAATTVMKARDKDSRFSCVHCRPVIWRVKTNRNVTKDTGTRSTTGTRTYYN